jgi:hypothetical protein
MNDGPRYVLVLRTPKWSRAYGPFDTADEAREACNLIGVADFEWDVMPLTENSMAV